MGKIAKFGRTRNYSIGYQKRSSLPKFWRTAHQASWGGSLCADFSPAYGSDCLWISRRRTRLAKRAPRSAKTARGQREKGRAEASKSRTSVGEDQHNPSSSRETRKDPTACPQGRARVAQEEIPAIGARHLCHASLPPWAAPQERPWTRQSRPLLRDRRRASTVATLSVDRPGNEKGALQRPGPNPCGATKRAHDQGSQTHERTAHSSRSPNSRASTLRSR